MALATAPTTTDSESASASVTVSVSVSVSDAAEPGIATRLATAVDALASVVVELEPDRLAGSDAAPLYADLARLERLVVAGKALLAPRIARRRHWEVAGHRSPVSLLATLEGVSTGQARRTLEVGQRLASLPSTEDVLRKGGLSGPKMAEISEAAVLDPSSEASLLAGAEDEPLHDVKERCQRVRATSARRDPVATIKRVHATRHFTSWTDAEGAFCYQGRDTADRGALLLSRLTPVVNRLRQARRAAAQEARPSPAKGRGRLHRSLNLKRRSAPTPCSAC
ncbi:MAG: hypothetical protein ACLQPH_06015 [Acidimicrobiales bacterium]